MVSTSSACYICLRIYFICCMCLTEVHVFNMSKTLYSKLYFYSALVSKCMFILLISCKTWIIKIIVGEREQLPNIFNLHATMLWFHFLCAAIKYGETDEGGPIINDPLLPWHTLLINRKKYSSIKERIRHTTAMILLLMRSIPTILSMIPWITIFRHGCYCAKIVGLHNSWGTP